MNIKFMRSVNVNDFMGGSVLFGRLSYYRLLEAAYEDDWIGDKAEGVSQWPTINPLTDQVPRNPKNDFEIELEFEPFGMGIRGGARDAVGAVALDCFAFCLSDGEQDQLAQVMMRQRMDEEPYDAAIQIYDIMWFSMQLWHLGDAFIHGKPIGRVRDLFTPFGGKVKYRPPGQTRHEGDARQIALSKDDKYRSQSERRFILAPNSPDLSIVGHQLFVRLGRMRRFARVLPHGPVAPHVQTLRRQPYDEAEQILASEDIDSRFREPEMQRRIIRALAQAVIEAKKKGYWTKPLSRQHLVPSSRPDRVVTEYAPPSLVTIPKQQGQESALDPPKAEDFWKPFIFDNRGPTRTA